MNHAFHTRHRAHLAEQRVRFQRQDQYQAGPEPDPARIGDVQVHGAKHAKQHGTGKQRVGARSEPRLGGAGGRVTLFHTQHDLLVRPDDQPHVQEHQCTGYGTQPDNGRAREVGRGTYQVKQYQTGQEGKHGAPTEPPQRPRSELLHGIGFRLGLCLLEILGLHKIEVIEHAYPDNPEQYVRPPEDKLEHQCSLLVVVKTPRRVHPLPQLGHVHDAQTKKPRLSPGLSLAMRAAYIMPPIPPIPPMSGMPPPAPPAALSSGASATITSVVIISAATEPAACNAARVTFAGSRIPISSMSPYSPVDAL